MPCTDAFSTLPRTLSKGFQRKEALHDEEA